MTDAAAADRADTKRIVEKQTVASLAQKDSLSNTQMVTRRYGLTQPPAAAPGESGTAGAKLGG